jgi:hypothetical protein
MLLVSTHPQQITPIQEPLFMQGISAYPFECWLAAAGSALSGRWRKTGYWR